MCLRLLLPVLYPWPCRNMNIKGLLRAVLGFVALSQLHPLGQTSFLLATPSQRHFSSCRTPAWDRHFFSLSSFGTIRKGWLGQCRPCNCTWSSGTALFSRTCTRWDNNSQIKSTWIVSRSNLEPIIRSISLHWSGKVKYVGLFRSVAIKTPRLLWFVILAFRSGLRAKLCSPQLAFRRFD